MGKGICMNKLKQMETALAPSGGQQAVDQMDNQTLLLRYKETGDMELTIRLVLLGQAAVYFPEPVARANFMLPNALTVDRSVLLCPLQAPAKESWQLIIGSHRYRRLPGGTAAFIEAAQTYYQSVLGP